MIKIHNADENVTPKFFADETKIYVTSMFRTIQGEGAFSGKPAVFLRVAGCNFGGKSSYCQFCDTSFFIGQAKLYSISELTLELQKLAGTQDLLVITGGEPTLQPLLLTLLLSIETLQPSMFELYQFESNGTNPDFATKLMQLPEEVCNKISFCVSPKTNYRTGKCSPLPDEVLKLVDQTGFLKFVISADESNPHHSIPEWAFALIESYGIPVYVSPMTIYLRAPVGEVASIWDTTLVDHVETRKNYEYAAAYVLANPGLQLSLQTHLFASVA